MTDGIACLLKKLQAGLVDTNSVAEIRRLTENYTKHAEFTPAEAGKLASEAFEHRTNALATQQLAYDIKSKHLKGLMADVPDAKEARVRADRFFLDDQQFAINSFTTTFNARFAEKIGKMGRNFSLDPTEADTKVLLEAIMNGKRPASKALEELAEAIKMDRAFANAELKRLGATGHRLPPENSISLDFDIGRLQGVSESDFAKDIMGSVDIKHLVSNVPYLSDIEGGLEGYLKMVGVALRDGSVTLNDEIRLLGTTPAEFIYNFKNHLVVTSPEAWYKMQSIYGGAGKKPNINSHVLARGINAARQAASLDYFAGNPKKLIDDLRTSLVARGFDSSDITSIVAKQQDAIKFFEGGYNSHIHIFHKSKVPFTNITFAPVEALDTFASYGAFLLGGSPAFSAMFSDPMIGRSVMTEMGFKQAGRLSALKKVTNGSIIEVLRDSPDVAAKLALTIDHVIDELNHTMRGNMAGMGARNVDKYASKFLRSTGMTWATNVGRRSNLINVATQLAELKDMAFDTIDEGTLRLFRRFNITKDDWDSLRTKWVRQEGTVDHISPANVIYEDPILGGKLAKYFALVQEMGTPTGSIRMQKFKAKWSSASPIQAAAATMITTFMGFNGSVWQNHIVRAIAGEAGAMSAYTRLAIYTTMGGALVETAKHIYKNEEPDFSSPEFWLRSYSTGGSASYFGMLLETAGRTLSGKQLNGLEGALGNQLAGFTGGTVLATADILLGAARSAYNEKDYNTAYKLFNLGYKFLPGQSHWAFNLLAQKAIRDPLRRLIDPRAALKDEKAQIAHNKKQGKKPLF